MVAEQHQPPATPQDRRPNAPVLPATSVVSGVTAGAAASPAAGDTPAAAAAGEAGRRGACNHDGRDQREAWHELGKGGGRERQDIFPRDNGAAYGAATFVPGQAMAGGPAHTTTQAVTPARGTRRPHHHQH